MSRLLNALQHNNSRTENGMATSTTTGNSNLDFFFVAGALRKAPTERITDVFSAAYEQDRLTALKILFWARDARKGAGERRLFREAMKVLAAKNPHDILVNLDLFPVYGRWDDLTIFLTDEYDGQQIQKAALWNISNALRAGDRLCAKWMPRKGVEANRIRSFMKLNWVEYRRVLSTISDTVEQKMCAKQFDSIEFGKVPSVAMSRYGKAFARNNYERFNAYMQALAKGEEKVNAGALYPYDVIRSLNGYGPNLPVAQAQWEGMPRLYDTSVERILPVCDTSGSMTCSATGSLSALDVCVSLGMYISEFNEGPFKDHFITFSTTPTLQKLTGNLLDRMRQLQRADWQGSTDLQAVFRLILDRAIRFSLAESDMPTMILIMSDMEFNAARGAHSYYGSSSDAQDNALEMIRKEYAAAGYTAPKIVFWNLASRHANNPVSMYDKNTALISGFSPNVLKSVLGGECDPVTVMNQTIEDERYEAVKVAGYIPKDAERPVRFIRFE
jgi:hypothetical protein